MRFLRSVPQRLVTVYLNITGKGRNPLTLCPEIVSPQRFCDIMSRTSWTPRTFYVALWVWWGQQTAPNWVCLSIFFWRRAVTPETKKLDPLNFENVVAPLTWSTENSDVNSLVGNEPGSAISRISNNTGIKTN